jgi:hypothetical protein
MAEKQLSQIGVQPETASQLVEIAAGCAIPETATMLPTMFCIHARLPASGLLESALEPSTKFPGQ